MLLLRAPTGHLGSPGCCQLHSTGLTCLLLYYEFSGAGTVALQAGFSKWGAQGCSTQRQQHWELVSNAWAWDSAFTGAKGFASSLFTGECKTSVWELKRGKEKAAAS